MVKRIDRLTPEQEARMTEWADRWIAKGLCTDPADWATFEDGARRCYQYAEIPWHGNVIRVSSPLVLSLAAPIAAALFERGAVDGAVGDAVSGAVDDAVDGAVTRHYIARRWWYRLGGQWWLHWQSWTSFFRDVCGLDLAGDLWDRDRAYADTQSSAGWWWPHRRFVMVCDRPAEVHTEQIGPRGWGSHRLHRADGPAIRWRDGYAIHFWHGVHVPADLIEGDGWSADRILRERNQEIRRCAIERVGWGRFIADAGLSPVSDPVPDPGNPGGDLALYDVPHQIFDEPVRVLLCLNGTVERDGTRRRYGLTVPAEFSDPVAAAAWTYDWPVAAYRQLARRA